MEEHKKRRIRYCASYPAAMYKFFRSYTEPGAPSFRKFADSIGTTLEELTLWRRHDEFDRSYRECSEIRRDYLIDNALTRRFDPSFVKFLLSEESGEQVAEDIEVAIRVVNGENSDED